MVVLFRTQDKGVDDDSRYGCADNKAKGHINSEVGGESCSDPEHSLDGDGQQHHETAAVPSRARARDGVSKVYILPGEDGGTDLSAIEPNTTAPTSRPNM